MCPMCCRRSLRVSLSARNSWRKGLAGGWQRRWRRSPTGGACCALWRSGALVNGALNPLDSIGLSSLGGYNTYAVFRHTHISICCSTPFLNDHLWRCEHTLPSATVDDSPPNISCTARKSSETSQCWLSAVAPLLWTLRENWREAGTGLGNMEPLKIPLKDSFKVSFAGDLSQHKKKYIWYLDPSKISPTNSLRCHQQLAVGKSPKLGH